ncbi:MAG: hypothetical protein RSE13_25300 [Planktothrix sp. GU0601_MAG3]|nr:MAG: hypothetical protein RSE13_25300 [Planktothrix sp. GU0601_MAG3]
MSGYNTIALAKTGDANAIAILINQALQSKGVTARVTRQEHHLQVVLESEQLPDVQGSVRVVQNGLMRLESPVIGSVTISGNPSRSKKIRLDTNPSLAGIYPNTPKNPRAVSFSGKPGFCRGSAPAPTLPIHDLQAFQGWGQPQGDCPDKE